MQIWLKSVILMLLKLQNVIIKSVKLINNIIYIIVSVILLHVIYHLWYIHCKRNLSTKKIPQFILN